MIKVALAIITDPKGKILLQHRDGKAPTNPNKWGLWGGRIEEGETPLEAVVRELKEELDIEVPSDRLTFLRDYKEKRFNDDWEGYIFHLQDENDFTYNLQEGAGLKFCSPYEIQNMDIDSIAGPIIGDYLKNT